MSGFAVTECLRPAEVNSGPDSYKLLTWFTSNQNPLMKPPMLFSKNNVPLLEMQNVPTVLVIIKFIGCIVGLLSYLHLKFK